MPRRRFSEREDLRPYSVLEHCVQCDFNDGQCNGWMCAAALAHRLSYYEYTCLSLPGMRNEKKEMAKRMMLETQVYVFVKLQIKWSLTPYQCVELFRQHDLMHFMKHNDAIYYMLDPNQALEDIEGMLRLSVGDYPCGDVTPKDPEALEKIYEEDLYRVVQHLLSLTKVPDTFRDAVFETCFFAIALSDDYRRVLAEILS